MLVTTTARDVFLDAPDPSAGLGAVVVIPTFNEASTVASILRRVLGLPGDFSIIVVDDGSPDGTALIVEAEQAAQCGYCINGMIMTTRALLDRNPNPSEDEIRQELAYNLCRCGTHVEIFRAVQRAAGQLDEQSAPSYNEG
jgi:xanthine dehydrogenase iron-sulfur cluster and FAD-binding subunit A